MLCVLVFVSLISMCLGEFLLGFILYVTLWLLDLIDYFLFHVAEIFNNNLFKNFLIPFLFLFFFWDLCNSNVGAFDIVPEVSWDYPRFFSFFLLYSALQKLFPPFYIPAHWFVLLPQVFCYCFLLEYFWRRQWHPTPVLLPGKSHGWRSLVGCSPLAHFKSDMTERLHFHFSLAHIGEGNGNPLRCSCLENPRDRGAWWAAVYGVAQGRTWLKWLSSSNRAFLISVIVLFVSMFIL